MATATIFNKCEYDGDRFGEPLAKIADYLWEVGVTMVVGLGIEAGSVLLDMEGRILGWKFLDSDKWQKWVFSEAASTLDIRMESPEDYIGGAYVVYKTPRCKYWYTSYTKDFEEPARFDTLESAIASLDPVSFDRYKVPVKGYV